MPSRTVRVEFQWENVKLTTVRVAHWTGRTIRQDPADCPPWPRGKAADRPPGPPELHTVLSSFEVNYGPPAVDKQTVRLKAIFPKNFAKTLDIKKTSMACGPSASGACGVLVRQTYQGGTRGSRLCGEDCDRETKISKVFAKKWDTRFIQVWAVKVANPTSCLGDHVRCPALGVG
jgi:hypothetical protein